MDLRKAVVCIAVSCVARAQAPVVTATHLVMDESGKHEEQLRKINGRWWTPDNREVYPPPAGGMFWQLDSKPGVVQFFHHRPFELRRAESLHLFMTPPEVEAALGQPNRILGSDPHANWFFYAADGTELTVRFMDGVLGEAKYQDIGENSSPVASVERELNGRSIYQVMAQRARQRSDEALAKRMEESRREFAARSEALRRGLRPSAATVSAVQARPGVVTVEAAPVAPAPPLAPPRVIAAELLASISEGATRDEVLARLGEPASRYAISGVDPPTESLTWRLDTGEDAIVSLVDGKVTGVRRR